MTIALQEVPRLPAKSAPKSQRAKDQQAVQRVVGLMGEARTAYHDDFTDACERRYRSYRGLVEGTDDMPEWMTRLYPKYGLQLIETITANLIDDRIDFDIDPYPMVGSHDIEALQIRMRGAKLLERLIKIDQELDHFDEQQRPWVLQAAITGLTVTKQYWDYSEQDVPRVVRADRTVHDEYGNIVGTVPEYVTNTKREILSDRSCVEVVNVKDFFWPESAVSLDRADWVIHRVYLTWDEIERLEALGVYSNVKDLVGTLAPGEGDMENAQESDVLFNTMRTKGMVEILELWSNQETIAVGNRQVLLRQKQNPFHHGEKPFVVTSGMPDMFKIPGISDMELIEDIQKMIWQLGGQQLDNVKMLANAIVVIASDVEDPDEFVFAPLERWIVDSPEQAKILEMNPIPAQIASEAIARLMGDMQNVTGGMPFMAGASSQALDQKTATGVSIVTTLAQRRLAAKKQNFTWAIGRIVDQRIQLMQQFFRRETLIPRVGADGAAVWEQVFPDEIQGRFIVRTRPTTESLLRQERRAESQALAQMFVQLAPVCAQMGVPLNARAFIENLLDTFDVPDPEYYFAQNQQPQAAGGGGNGQPPAPPGANMGTTAETAVDAASPSATGGVSQSGEVMNQRAGAASGGAQGVVTTT